MTTDEPVGIEAQYKAMSYHQLGTLMRGNKERAKRYQQTKERAEAAGDSALWKDCDEQQQAELRHWELCKQSYDWNKELEQRHEQVGRMEAEEEELHQQIYQMERLIPRLKDQRNQQAMMESKAKTEKALHHQQKRTRAAYEAYDRQKDKPLQSLSVTTKSHLRFDLTQAAQQPDDKSTRQGSPRDLQREQGVGIMAQEEDDVILSDKRQARSEESALGMVRSHRKSWWELNHQERRERWGHAHLKYGSRDESQEGGSECYEPTGESHSKDAEEASDEESIGHEAICYKCGAKWEGDDEDRCAWCGED